MVCTNLKDGMASYEIRANIVSGAQLDVGRSIKTAEIETDAITSALISPQVGQWGANSVITGSGWTSFATAFTTAPTSIQVTGMGTGSTMDFAVQTIAPGSFLTIGSAYVGDITTGSFSYVAFGVSPA